MTAHTKIAGGAFIKRHWHGRTAPERQILTVIAALLAPLFAYAIAWQPAHTAVAKLNISVPVMRAQALQLQAQAAAVATLRQHLKPAVLDAHSLKATIESTALRYQIREAISTLEAQDPNAVRITLTAVTFEQWLRFLHALQKEQHVRADSTSIAALPQAGMVKISATLVNGGSP